MIRMISLCPEDLYISIASVGSKGAEVKGLQGLWRAPRVNVERIVGAADVGELRGGFGRRAREGGLVVDAGIGVGIGLAGTASRG